VKISIEEFKEAFSKLLAPSDKVIVIHSGIWTFGSRINLPTKEVPQAVIEAIIEAVGPDRTLLFPTFTYYYSQTRKFNLKTSKPETGILPELFLKRKGVLRSANAMNSYGVIGPEAETVTKLKGQSVWGKDSVMDWYVKKNALVCMIGLEWHLCCTLYHYLEELGCVPYRYFKHFPGTWSDGINPEIPWSESLYVRPLPIPVDYRWEIIADAMRAEQKICSAKLDSFFLESCLSGDIVSWSKDTLLADPLAFVINRDEVNHWITYDKQEEVRKSQLPLPT